MNFIKDNDLCFEIDKENLIAKLIESPNVGEDVLIPYSINFQSENYIVKYLSENVFMNNRTCLLYTSPNTSPTYAIFVVAMLKKTNDI